VRLDRAKLTEEIRIHDSKVTDYLKVKHE